LSSYFKKSIVLFILTISSICNVFSQEEVKKKSVFKTILGNQLESSVIFLPCATHTIRPDFFTAWYTAYSYKGLEGGVFLNTYRDWTAALLYKRSWNFTKRFSVNYSFGILYGYKGRLHNIHHIAITNNFLFAGPINPVAGLELDYNISKKLVFRIDIVPLAVLYGFRYILPTKAPKIIKPVSTN
jgi:hypothetical protein